MITTYQEGYTYGTVGLKEKVTKTYGNYRTVSDSQTIVYD